MERLTKLNGIGEYELQACFECGPGCGSDNENCGTCEKVQAGVQRLGEYETAVSIKENNVLSPQEAGVRCQRKHDCKIECLLDEYNKLQDERDALKVKLESAIADINAASTSDDGTCTICEFSSEDTADKRGHCWSCTRGNTKFKWRGEQP